MDRLELNDQQKEKALSKLLKTINNNGTGAKVSLADNIPEIEAIPTGIPGLDWATGVGGFPKGRFTEVYGGSQSGKTHIALKAALNVAKAGGYVAFCDLEQAFSPGMLTFAGWPQEGEDPDDLRSRFVHFQPVAGENAIDGVVELMSSGVFDMVIVDSMTSMVPTAVQDGDADRGSVGEVARLKNKALRKWINPAAIHNVAVVMISQVRNKAQGMFFVEDSDGGKALEFWTSLRVMVNAPDSKAGRVMDGKKMIGRNVDCKIKKSKFGPSGRETKWQFMFDGGVDSLSNLWDLAKTLDVVEVSGRTHTLHITGKEPMKLGTSAAEAESAWAEDSNLVAMTEEEIRRLTHQALGAGVTLEEEDLTVADSGVRDDGGFEYSNTLDIGV